MENSKIMSREMRAVFLEKIPTLVGEQLVGDGQIVQIKALEFGLVIISPDLSTLTGVTFSHGENGFELTALDHFTNPYADEHYWESTMMTDEQRIK